MSESKTLLHAFHLTNDFLGDFTIEYHKPGVANVELLSYTMFPEDTVYMLTRAYKGIYRLNMTAEDIKEYPQQQAFEDIKNTKLQTPLEMLNTTWLLTDVSRAFTHQLVRYRVGTAFIQESMRFYGVRKVYKILTTGIESKVEFELYTAGINEAIYTYVDLLSRNIADQDARGALPTNILTNIYFHCSLRTLQNIIPQRLCCQAQQGEWQPILRKMRKMISERMGKYMEELLQAPYERDEDCGYRASFDRDCVWQHKDE
jgi:flavin-dependent thymidylate synthase